MRTSSEFYHSSRLRDENQRKWKNRLILGSCQRIEKVVEHKSDSDTNCSWCTWNGLQRLGKETGTNENQWMNSDHLDYSIIDISQNT